MVGGFVFPGWKYKAIEPFPWAAMLERDEPVEGTGSGVFRRGLS
jgi:hypothetical protein